MVDKSQCFELGTIVKSIGKDGTLLLIIDADQPKNYSKLESMFVEVNQTLVPFFITRITINSNGEARVLIDGLSNELDVLPILGKTVFLPLSVLKPLTGKKFYFHEVIGFQAKDEIAGIFGRISDVFDTSSQPIIQVMNDDNKEILIPVDDTFIQSIDRKNKVFNFNLPNGLLDLYLNV
jgi:16S rRNA processing protein RimM